MSNTMVPCTSGKCGVKSHILGSADQKACASGGANSYEARLRHVSPPSLDGNWTLEGLRVFRYDSKNQVEAVKKRDLTIAGTPTGNKVADFAFRLRNNPAKRHEIATKQYAEGRWDEKVQESFARVLDNAYKGQYSKEGGESVIGFKVPDSYSSFQDIKYRKDQDGIYIDAVEEDGSESSFRFDRNEIAYRNEFPNRSVEMRSGGHLNAESIIYKSHGNPANHNYTKDLIELLVHCQNERNWF